MILKIFALSFGIISFVKSEKCLTTPCVQSAANIIERIDPLVDPCYDFYSYACGSFESNVFTPDEKSTVDSISLMNDQLQEFLLSLLSAPIEKNESKNHKLAKRIFQQCIDYDRVNERGKEPLLKVLEAIGGFPMVEREWSAADWEWESAIINLRQNVSRKSDNIFKSTKNETIAEISSTKNFALDEKFDGAEGNLKVLMKKVAISLGAKDDEILIADVNDLVIFEKTLSDYFKKFKIFRRRKSTMAKPNIEFQLMYKRLLWLELFSPNVVMSEMSIEDNLPDDLNVMFYNFLKTTEKRTLANYVAWRVVQATIFLLGEEFRQIFLDFEQSSFGTEDFEQRWKLCTSLVSDRAPVAVGTLYISRYFSESDKCAAEKMVDDIIEEFKQLIRSSVWMDEGTKANALEKANNMLKFIGYHEKLGQQDAHDYYNELAQWDDFFEMVLSLVLYRTDKDFKRVHSKKAETDWTKYSIPATVNAFYNSKDNSIQFPAGILQFPLYDRVRPDFLNFGSIGSIIGHEITHAFDDESSKLSTWSTSSQQAYDERVKCLIDQYGSFRVPEVEKFFNISEFRLNGARTIRENIADNGGLKLALYSFKKRSNYSNDISLVGLNSLSSEKLFFLSFAQAFCSVERPAKMKSNVESDVHALNKFRVNGVLSNSEEFSNAWNCSRDSVMNPEKKCALW